MKIVLDSNVLISAFGSHGLCESLMQTCLERHDLFTSEHLLRETAEHLADKYRMKKEPIAEIIELLREESTLVEAAGVPADACRDPDDLPVLGTAQAAEADYLVTGDKDLLVLLRFGKTEIVTPRQFYEKLLAENP